MEVLGRWKVWIVLIAMGILVVLRDRNRGNLLYGSLVRITIII